MKRLDKLPKKNVIFVCNEGKCRDSGAPKLIREIKDEIAKRDAKDKIQVVGCACLGVCKYAPNAVAAPQGMWWRDFGKKNCAEIVEEALGGGKKA